MARFAPGDVIGDRFEIIGPLGRGGMATVWLAQDRLRGESVALKVLHEHLAAEPAMRARLRREVQAAGRLRHPNALVAHELHEIDGQLVLAMPAHPGGSLADRVAERGPLSASELRRLLDEVGGALAAAHAHGVLHRDVTPNNVLVGDDGRFSLVDFGLARLDGQATATGQTGALGTAGYAAPEVYRGTRADPRSDLYGLGATLWFAATGKPPFDAKNPVGVLEKQLAGTLPPLDRDDLPEALARTIRAMLSVEPDDRPDGADGAIDAEPGPPRRAPVRRGLPAGGFAVEVHRPRDRDAARQKRKRNRDGRKMLEALQTIGAQVDPRIGEVVGTGIRTLGLDAPTAEESLTAAVANVAHLPAGSLQPSAVLEARHFRLVEEVDEATAITLAAAANGLGVQAKVVPTTVPAPSLFDTLLSPLVLAVLIAAVLLYVFRDGGGPGYFWFFLFFGFPFRLFRRTPDALPVAYPRDLRAMLDPGHAALAADLAPDAAPHPEKRTLAERTGDRLAAVRARLDALPDAARRDLAAALARIEARVRILAQEIGHLAPIVADRDDAGLAAEASRVEARLARLATLRAAGQAVDEAEIARLTATLDGHHAALASAAEDEGHLARLHGELLSLSAAVARADRALADAPDSADAAAALVAHVARVEAVRAEMDRKPDDPLDRARRAAAARDAAR